MESHDAEFREGIPKPTLRSDKVEGVDYSPEGIRALREKVIALRDEAMRNWPEGIDESVVLSHAVALLSAFADSTESAIAELGQIRYDLAKWTVIGIKGKEITQRMIHNPSDPNNASLGSIRGSAAWVNEQETIVAIRAINGEIVETSVLKSRHF